MPKKSSKPINRYVKIKGENKTLLVDIDNIRSVVYEVENTLIINYYDSDPGVELRQPDRITFPNKKSGTIWFNRLADQLNTYINRKQENASKHADKLWPFSSPGYPEPAPYSPPLTFNTTPLEQTTTEGTQAVEPFSFIPSKKLEDK